MDHPRPELVASERSMLAWIRRICDQGIRRPGSAADAWAERWVAERFRQLGLHDVRLEEVVLPRWEPRSASLRVWRTDTGDHLFCECFPLPHTAPAPGGLDAPLVPLDAGDARGAVALERVELMRYPQTVARGIALDHHDPDGAFDGLVQTLPFGPQLQNVMQRALDAGAAGFVGVFDAPWESCDYYVPYDAEPRPIPGVWVSRSDGERIQRLLEAERNAPVFARIHVDATREPVVTHNVVGVLRGASDEWVVIGSHHDAPWASAVEDASGVALVGAQARYWAGVPRASRPHNLLFLVTSGHMAGGAGTAAFIDRHRDLLERVVCEIHLEHPARECVGRDGELVPTGEPEVRWWFTSRNPELLEAVGAAIRAEDLRRSLVLPPDAFGPHPTTDGGFFHTAGVPLVNFLTAPMYLFDSRDTIDKIHPPSLVEVTRAAVRIVASTAGLTAERMRAGVQGA